jgi:hypothetical protein
MEGWKPPVAGGHWLEWLVILIPDQGTWDTKYARYRLDRTNKIAYVIARNTARPAELIENTCRRIAQAFGAIGWRVMDIS